MSKIPRFTRMHRETHTHSNKTHISIELESRACAPFPLTLLRLFKIPTYIHSLAKYNRDAAAVVATCWLERGLIYGSGRVTQKGVAMLDIRAHGYIYIYMQEEKGERW